MHSRLLIFREQEVISVSGDGHVEVSTIPLELRMLNGLVVLLWDEPDGILMEVCSRLRLRLSRC